MVRSPIIILLELLIGIVVYSVQYLFWLISKLIELFQSLHFHPITSFIGLVVLLVISLVVVFVVRKEVFSSIKAIIFFALIIFLILIAFVFGIFHLG